MKHDGEGMGKRQLMTASANIDQEVESCGSIVNLVKIVIKKPSFTRQTAKMKKLRDRLPGDKVSETAVSNRCLQEMKESSL